MCREVLGETAASKISTNPLSADTIRRRIIDMGEDIEHQLYANLEANKFVIQLDESMDIAQKALILIFVRYRHGDDFMEDLLACDELQTKTNDEFDMFENLDDLLSKSVDIKDVIVEHLVNLRK
uniref:protein FAM200A-like n=1 Tax=Myxine glutinosa TaxID=7769 RepID=UPI00358E1FF3